MKIRDLILYSMILSFCVTGLVQAQGSTKIFGVGGYGFGISNDEFMSSYTYDSNWELDDRTDHYINGGKGMKYGGGIELPIRPNVALRAEYCMSSMPEITAVDEYEADNTKYETKTTAKGWNISAVVLIQVPMDKKTLYGGLGGGYFNASATVETEFPAYIIDYTGYIPFFEEVEGLEQEKVTMSSAIGLVGVLGIVRCP
ncbi:hypothetical protein HQ585_03250 [candidate division KSB1 bacterium]|nr:hypothetical protein [candidate division KSB1 bacterium]